MTFEGLFVPTALREAVSDRAWVAAMLEAERALANAEALTGVIPAHVAAAIADRCRVELFDVDEIIQSGRRSANPAEPLVRALRGEVGGEAASFVHYGATSQDVVDSAAMLVAGRARRLIVEELDAVATACAGLARAHRTTVMAARTLLQQAVPTTFGLRAAGWLDAVLDARGGLLDVELAAQLGGAAGTLAPVGEHGLEVARLYAAELDLADPGIPWHTNRIRIARLAGALEITTGALAKIGLDVALLSQTEVAEVAESEAGGSSTMPQKRNPVGAVLARACAFQVHGHASVLTGALAQELERAAGAWQSEWTTLSSALALTGGAAAAVRGVVEGLEIDAERMRANLDSAIVAERLAFELMKSHGREDAHRLVAESDWSELDVPAEAFDPTTYLGSAAAFVDRVLARCEEKSR